MKKLTISIVLCLFTICSLKAQSWEAGLTTGLNNSFQSGKLISNGVEAEYQSKYGCEIGLALNKRITKRFYLNTGLSITKRATGEIGLQMDSLRKANITYRLTDFTIPLQFNFRFPLSEKLTFSPTVGVDFGFFVNSKTQYKYDDGRSYEFKSTYAFSLNPQKAHVFLGVGLGMMYRINNKFSLVATPKISTDVNFANWDNLHNASLHFTLLYAIPKRNVEYAK